MTLADQARAEALAELDAMTRDRSRSHEEREAVAVWLENNPDATVGEVIERLERVDR